jgi:hypothetical protein
MAMSFGSNADCARIALMLGGGDQAGQEGGGRSEYAVAGCPFGLTDVHGTVVKIITA